MRIVGGTYRSRTIAAPKGEGTRPTTDRVREALFSTLGSAMGGFDGIRVLDAFAGSGALGLEAISRGAAFSLFTDTASAAVACIKKNAASLGVPSDSYAVVKADIAKSVALAAHHGPFDLVFLDPPYAMEPADVLALVDGLDAAGALGADVTVSYEHARGTDIDAALAAHAAWERYTAKVYGDTAIDIIVRKGTE